MSIGSNDIAVVIVAAGRGTRAGGDTPKQWRMLAGRRVVDHTLDRFREIGLNRIVVVTHADDSTEPLPNDVLRVTGGATRGASVFAGLEALASDPPRIVLIHDAARATTPGSVIAEVLEALETHDAAAPGLPVTDALWRGDAFVAGTQDRTGLVRAQTPQGFRFDAILAAHRASDSEAADDVAVARQAGLRVAITPGDPDNLKITTPRDFLRAERLLERAKRNMDVRIGNGFDVHRFGPGDHVVLCGVKVPFERGLQGHSDADVGMHAVTDAIYGALAEGDIGTHFPPSDPQWKGAESHIFLRHAVERVAARGFALTHVDCTLVCERPKIGPLATEMRAAMAEILGIPVDRVSVKATTSERLGFTGREEGIAAIASATLVAS